MTREDEAKLMKMFTSIREDLVNMVEPSIINTGIMPGDLADNAFAYLCSGIEKGKVSRVPADCASLKRALFKKIDFLVKDAYRALKTSRIGRSVRAMASLDSDGDSDFPVDRIVAMDRFHEEEQKKDYVFRCSLVRRTMELVLRQIGMSDINRRIFEDCVWHDMSRQDVVKKYNVTRNNTDAIVFRGKKALAKFGPAIFKRLYDDAA